jgi:hypothetical protein
METIVLRELSATEQTVVEDSMRRSKMQIVNVE